MRGADGRERGPHFVHRTLAVGGVRPGGDVRQGVAPGVQPEMRADQPGDRLGLHLAPAPAAVAAVLQCPHSMCASSWASTRTAIASATSARTCTSRPAGSV